MLANKKEVVKIPVAKWYFDTLTEEQAFDLACHDNSIQDNVLPHDVNTKNFSKIDGFEAVLELFFHKTDKSKKTMSPEEFEKKKIADKMARKEEK